MSKIILIIGAILIAYGLYYVNENRSNRVMMMANFWMKTLNQDTMTTIYSILSTNEYSKNVISEMYKEDPMNNNFFVSIIKGYQGYLAKYFENACNGMDRATIRKTSKLTQEEFFVVYMFEYLEKYEASDYLVGYDLYHIVEKKSYGMYGGELFDATCQLTKYGKWYYELQYSVHKYIMSNHRIEKLGIKTKINVITQALDSGKISVSSIR